MLTTIAIENYRSLRDLRLPLEQLNVITGANGTGKSSLYRALRLLADCGSGRVISSLAREGGLESALWAGPEHLAAAVRSGRHPVQGTVRSGPVSLQLGFASDDFSYLIDLGLPTRDESSAFNLDPEIKREVVWSGPVMRPASVLIKRKRASVELRDTSSRGDAWQRFESTLRPYESVLTEVLDPVRAPEVMAVREQIRSWRFYDQFRTDSDAPVRQSQIGTRTPVLDADGRDLAAALQTIIEIGDTDALHGTIEDAFPGSRLQVIETRGRFDLELNAHGLLRPLSAAELSDGTLRYLLLVAALLSPRPPSLMVLNEPETSLHVDLLPALARLIARASVHTQIVVVTHARKLVEALTTTGAQPLCLVKDFGATTLEGIGPLEQPPWNWGSR
ncbi:MAG TPA: AAA family ATPase [Propionibacteriaceae bacterium]|nr:AAA family ATPase [Propionibacteriaceae bacterium]